MWLCHIWYAWLFTRNFSAYTGEVTFTCFKSVIFRRELSVLGFVWEDSSTTTTIDISDWHKRPISCIEKYFVISTFECVYTNYTKIFRHINVRMCLHKLHKKRNNFTKSRLPVFHNPVFTYKIWHIFGSMWAR